ncbi:unnamed protein product [Cuscuta epithymum]|uniref:HMA domain-containing protein n=2 Tax=Cuscuta epithymum TaxID=186058 RepID=A0AAV0GJ39_9ASTE|nr:unnamed protein product [Cuscuta epithymum]CAH9147682.1 unnamed protein product [Cuscuta epithymum]
MKKQKVVISTTMSDEKARIKAHTIAVSQPGVVSASVDQQRGRIEVIGEFDAVAMAIALRKKLGHADILMVAHVVEKKEEKKDEKKEEKKDEKKEEKKDEKKEEKKNEKKEVKQVEKKKDETPEPQIVTAAHYNHHYYTYPVNDYDRGAGCTLF